MMRALDARAVRRLVRYVLLAAMAWSLVVLAGMAVWGGDSLAPALRALAGPLAAATLAAFAANHALRFLRWHLMLRAEHHAVPWARSLAIFLAGLALLPTPAKAGVAARSVLLLDEGVPVHVSLAAYFAERLLDLVGLVVLAAVLLAPGNAGLMAAVAAVAGVAAVAIAPRLLRAVEGRAAAAPRMARALEWAATCFADAGDMIRGWRLPVFVALGMAANVVAGLLIHAALSHGGIAVDAVTCVGVLAVSHLSGSISMLPGGIGGFDVAMLAQLSGLGVPPLDALAALWLVRIATLWGSVAVGMPLLWIGMRRAAPRAA